MALRLSEGLGRSDFALMLTLCPATDEIVGPTFWTARYRIGGQDPNECNGLRLECSADELFEKTATLLWTPSTPQDVGRGVRHGKSTREGGARTSR